LSEGGAQSYSKQKKNRRTSAINPVQEEEFLRKTAQKPKKTRRLKREKAGPIKLNQAGYPGRASMPAART